MKIFGTITLALCVAAAVSCAPQNNEKEEGMKKTNEVIETIMARRSIRQYKAEPVARETMDTILMWCIVPAFTTG